MFPIYLVQVFLHLSLDFGNILLCCCPKNTRQHLRITMNQNMAHTFHLFPWNLRVAGFVFYNLNDIGRIFDNVLQTTFVSN